MNNDNLNPTQDDSLREDILTPETPVEETLVAEATVEETPVTESPAEEVPVFETPVTDTSVAEEAPTPVETSQPLYTQPLTPPPYQAPPYQAPNTQPASVPNQPVQPAPQPVYYYGAPAPAPEPPKKKKKGHIAFLVCLFTLIGIFAVGFFVLCGYVAGQNSGFADFTKPTFFNEFGNDEDTEPASDAVVEDTPEGVVPLPEKDEDVYSSDGSISLESLPRDKSDTDKYTTQYAYKKVAESTIGVVCYESGFTGEPASQGTGIVITKDGYIATNSHVIGDSRSAYSIQVVTNDGTTYEAKVVGYDSRTDLAVLKVNANNLTPAEFCDSDLVEVGIDVIAVGNPGGMDFQNSLTRGVVSALNRELGLSAQVTYIQTDAAINPGNSGGPLSNMYGQVIGITTAKISSESVEGMGFAIPSRTVKEIVDDLMTQGYVSDRVRLGISGQAVSSSMQTYYNLPGGILVGEIAENGPCYNTELKVNDIITKIDDDEITDFSDVYAVLGEHKPGDEVVLTVYRRDTAKTFEVTITLMADEGQTQQ
ncbi:MAG: trypsin-like peptidase domain-containing protein [Ruminococcus sp.]|nr:trypsin-like peptidase domain-containing protein [Ruminococcus sp.]